MGIERLVRKLMRKGSEAEIKKRHADQWKEEPTSWHNIARLPVRITTLIAAMRERKGKRAALKPSGGKGAKGAKMERNGPTLL